MFSCWVIELTLYSHNEISCEKNLILYNYVKDVDFNQYVIVMIITDGSMPGDTELTLSIGDR